MPLPAWRWPRGFCFFACACRSRSSARALGRRGLVLLERKLRGLGAAQVGVLAAQHLVERLRLCRKSSGVAESIICIDGSMPPVAYMSAATSASTSRSPANSRSCFAMSRTQTGETVAGRPAPARVIVVRSLGRNLSLCGTGRRRAAGPLRWSGRDRRRRCRGSVRWTRCSGCEATAMDRARDNDGGSPLRRLSFFLIRLPGELTGSGGEDALPHLRVAGDSSSVPIRPREHGSPAPGRRTGSRRRGHRAPT